MRACHSFGPIVLPISSSPSGSASMLTCPSLVLHEAPPMADGLQLNAFWDSASSNILFLCCIGNKQSYHPEASGQACDDNYLCGSWHDRQGDEALQIPRNNFCRPFRIEFSAYQLAFSRRWAQPPSIGFKSYLCQIKIWRWLLLDSPSPYSGYLQHSDTWPTGCGFWWSHYRTDPRHSSWAPERVWVEEFGSSFMVSIDI